MSGPVLVHTPACLAQQAWEMFAVSEREAQRRAWWARWPKACPSCEGMGVWTVSNYPYAPDDEASCAFCVDGGRCPRCTRHTLDLDVGAVELVCVGCGWHSDLVEDRACPPPYETIEALDTCFCPFEHKRAYERALQAWLFAQRDSEPYHEPGYDSYDPDAQRRANQAVIRRLSP